MQHGPIGPNEGAGKEIGGADFMAFVADVHQRFESSMAKLDSFIESQKNQDMGEKEAADFFASGTGIKTRHAHRKRIPCFQGNEHNLMAVTYTIRCLSYSALISRK